MGKGYRTYLFEYRFEGAIYGLDVVARSQKEAKQRLAACSLSGRCVGELVATIPAAPGAGLLVRLATWWKNRGERT